MKHSARKPALKLPTILYVLLGAGLCLGMLTPTSSHAGDAAYSAEVLVKSNASWDGQALPAYPEARPMITILRIRIPPGTSLPMHKHPVINAGVLQSGALTVVAENGRTLHLKAGDALIELVDTWHFGRNDGDVPAEIIVFYVGAENLPISVPQPAND